MICPKCHSDSLIVIDSRPATGVNGTRRRKKCTDCGYRFSTYEQTRADLVAMAKQLLSDELFGTLMVAVNKSERNMHSCINEALEEVFNRNTTKNSKRQRYDNYGDL